MTLACCSRRSEPCWRGNARAIALIGFGFVVERFGLFLRMVCNQPLLPSQRGFSLWLGISLLVIAAGVSVVSALQFRTVLRSLGERVTPIRVIRDGS